MTRISDPASDYASKVLSDNIVAGPHVRAACQRHMRDCQRTDIYWDQDAVDRVLKFFNQALVLLGGQYERNPFRLFPWQKFIVASLFGWKKTVDGTRRYRRAFIETAKGSGKSPLASGLGLYMTCADREIRAQTWIIARTADQARVCMDMAVAMCELSSPLSQRTRIRGGDNPTQIFYDSKNGATSWMKRTASAKAGAGKSGPNAHFLICDEYHEHDSGIMLDYFVKSFKQRSQPLAFIITNAGSDSQSACGIEHDMAVKISQGELENDSYFSYVCSMDDDDQPYEDESCWLKSNPSLPALPGYEYIREEVKNTLGAPSKKAETDRLIFCTWTRASHPWLEPRRWNDVVVDELSPYEERKDKPCYIGLDLSRTTDLTAGVVTWDMGGGLFESECMVWTPQKTMRNRALKDQLPYQHWVDLGHMRATPGEIISYGDFADWIASIYRDYRLLTIAYDSWNVDLLRGMLLERGLPLSDGAHAERVLWIIHYQNLFGGMNLAQQGKCLAMPNSIRASERIILEKRIKVKRNLALDNAVYSTEFKDDATGNRMFNKKNILHARIDPAVALVESVGTAEWKPVGKVTPTERYYLEEAGLARSRDDTPPSESGAANG